MSYLSLALLGPMQIKLEGQPIVTFPYEKLRALLAYLAIESYYPHHRDTLAALLWAEQSHADARSNLRKALSTLRHLLDDSSNYPPLLLTTRHTIQFNRASHYSLDVTLFSALLDCDRQQSQSTSEWDSDAIATLEQAVALYRGPFLDRLHLLDCEAFDRWMFQHRQRLYDQVVEACTKLIWHYEQQGHTQKAQQYAQQQLHLEPWNEAAHRCLMRTLAQQGRRTAALEQFSRYCQILKQELATEPDVETVELWQAIRSGSFPNFSRDSSAKQAADVAVRPQIYVQKSK